MLNRPESHDLLPTMETHEANLNYYIIHTDRKIHDIRKHWMRKEEMGATRVKSSCKATAREKKKACFSSF